MKTRLVHFFIFFTSMSGAALLSYGGNAAWQGAAGLCALSIAFSVAVATPRLRKLLHGEIPDFLSVFLIFEVLNKILTIISLAAGDSYMKPYEAADLVEELYAFRAEAAHLVALALFSLGWLLIERSMRRSVPDVRRNPSSSFLLRFYIAVTVLGLGLQGLHNPSLGMLSNFFQYSALAVIGTLLASNTAWGLGGKRSWLSILLLAPPFYVAMSSGTKGALVLVALPLLIASLSKGLGRIMVVLIPFAIFMLAVGIPLSQEMRSANWESVGGREEIGVTEGLSRVAERYVAGEAMALIEETSLQFCNRASSAQMGGVVMAVAERDGLIGTEPIKLLPAMFIPRVLWPDKPVFRPGAWFTWYLGKAATPESASSATATMLGTEMYWMFGAPGLLMAVLLGMLYAAAWRGFTTMSHRSLMGFAGMYALLGAAVRFEEYSVVYAVSIPITYLAYSYALTKAEVLLTKPRRMIEERQ